MYTLFKKHPLFIKYNIFIKIILMILFSRIVLFFIGITSRHFLGPPESLKETLLYVWAQWDAGWYHNIASSGYVIDHTYNPYFGDQVNYAFFPLYPTLMKIFNVFFNDYTISGIFVSNLCFLVASIYLYKLSLFYFNKEKSFEVVTYFVFFPASFLFSCVLTESLYLTFVLMCFYYAKKGNWLVVGIFGFFLALTRNMGVFIIVPLFLQYLISVNFKLYKIKYNILYLLFIPFGFVLWGMYLYYLTGDFLMFKNVQVSWDRISSNPISVLYHSINSGQFNEVFWSIFVLAFSLIILMNIKKIPVPYLIFAAYSLIIPLSTSVTSMIRYSIVIFPIYLSLAYMLENKYLKMMSIYLMLTLQGLFMVFWSSGYTLIF